jgi:hypothetical protein
VRVEIITPGPDIDQTVVRIVGRKRWGRCSKPDAPQLLAGNFETGKPIPGAEQSAVPEHS